MSKRLASKGLVVLITALLLAAGAFAVTTDSDSASPLRVADVTATLTGNTPGCC